MADRFFSKCKDRFTIFRRVYVFHQEPRSDEWVLLADLGSAAQLHTGEKQQSATIEKQPASGITNSPMHAARFQGIHKIYKPLHAAIQAIQATQLPYNQVIAGAQVRERLI